MRHVIYKLKIPNPLKINEYEEFTISDPKIICEKLSISMTCFNRILNGTMKYSHQNKKYLEGVIIEKEYLESKRIKKTKEEIKKEQEEYRLNIISNLKNTTF